MLENIISLVREHASDAIVNNPAVPNEQNEAVTEEAGNSIMDGLKNMISQGQAGDVLNLFSHPSSDFQSHPAVQSISGTFIQNLVAKFGLDPSAAGNVASNLIPTVLQNLVHKTNDTADSSFNLESIVGHLTGGQGLQGLLGSFGQGGGAGVMDKLKGLF
ncbi:MAG: hypothetical protein JST68_06425 [Bacteroidetes bacterium]|nr:hypothetical protein [Bacteroidota bacterium]